MHHLKKQICFSVYVFCTILQNCQYFPCCKLNQIIFCLTKTVWYFRCHKIMLIFLPFNFANIIIKHHLSITFMTIGNATILPFSSSLSFSFSSLFPLHTFANSYVNFAFYNHKFMFVQHILLKSE